MLHCLFFNDISNKKGTFKLMIKNRTLKAEKKLTMLNMSQLIINSGNNNVAFLVLQQDLLSLL